MDWAVPGKTEPVRHPKMVFVILLALALGMTSNCSNRTPVNPPDLNSTPTSLEPLGDGLPDFYSTIPDPSNVPAGTLLASQSITYQALPNSAWRIAYSSLSPDGHPITVTGLVILPLGQPPTGGWPVVSWAHSTTGIADQCAPSADPSRLLPAVGLLSNGFAFVATDYEGLGTTGRHPYLVSASEGRSVLDIALAATRVTEWNISNRVAVWGHSQGGHAALAAMTMAERFSPELNVFAIAAGAPASGFEESAIKGETHSTRHLALLIALGFNSTDPERLPLNEILTDSGIGLTETAGKVCSQDLKTIIDSLPNETELVKSPPSDRWLEELRSNDPLTISSSSDVPLLLMHGANDGIVSVDNSRRIQDRLCALKQDSELWIDPNADHISIVSATYPTMIQWLRLQAEHINAASIALSDSLIRIRCG